MDPTKTLPRRLSSASEDATPALLAVVQGGVVARSSVALREQVLVGRDPTSSLAVDDASLSRSHFAIREQGRAWEVEDLGSRNGTFLDGQRVRAPREVRAGSVIRAAASMFLVVGDASAASHLEIESGWGLVGGFALRPLRARLRAAAADDGPLVIVAPTGTGKELAAHAIHAESGRSGAFVPVNCAAIPGSLFESELFGHARGAYSGAGAARSGLIRSAEGGTLFLDEIGELPLELQPKLLRFLEDGIVRPVGDDRGKKVACRIVAATHRDLPEMAARGAFREDLLHRLRGDVITIPALGTRREDIPALTRHFLGEAESPESPSVDVLEVLCLNPWPGNVRQLRNEVLRAARQARAAESRQIDIEHLSPALQQALDGEPESASETLSNPPIDAPAKEAFLATLAASKGNVTVAAETLKMRRATAYELMRRWGIDPRRYRS